MKGFREGALLCISDGMDLTEFIPGVTEWVGFLTKVDHFQLVDVIGISNIVRTMCP